MNGTRLKSFLAFGVFVVSLGNTPSRAYAGPNPAAVFHELISFVENRHSYAMLEGLDFDAAAAEEIERLGDDPSRGEVVLAVQRFVARLGDGHAGVEDFLDDWAPDGRLGFLIQETGDGWVAFERNPFTMRGRFLVSDKPFLESIDGVPVERWIEAASRYEPIRAPHAKRWRAARHIRFVNLVRDELGLAHAPVVRLKLRGVDGVASTVVRVSDRRAIFGRWPRRRSGVLEGGFGYLRIDDMSLDGDDLAELKEEVDGLVETPGLVIDVRGNGGGRRDALRVLLPYFLDRDQGGHASRVVNVAKARPLLGQDPARERGYLDNRFLWPMHWDGWTDRERGVIEAFAETFEPEWEPREPEGTAGYSDWHYMVVSTERPYAQGSVKYAGPIVILMDTNCFSATDIFLGAFKALDGATLVGTASAGGSARARGYDLETLGVEVDLGYMASFQPDGTLYDGNGVAPDVEVRVTPGDLIGETDTQLDRALSILRKQAEPGRP